MPTGASEAVFNVDLPAADGTCDRQRADLSAVQQRMGNAPNHRFTIDASEQGRLMAAMES
jgi:hypothetical protein